MCRSWKTLCDLNRLRKKLPPGQYRQNPFKGTELTVGVDVTAPSLGMDAAASLRVLVAGVLDLGRARGRAGCRGGVVWGCGGVVGATRGGLVIRRWCLHAW